MATTLQTLVDRTRNFLRDTPDYDTLTASLSNSTASTTVTVADVTVYRSRWPIEVDYETMMIRSAPSSGTTMTVARGWRGSAVAAHASGAPVLIRPAWYAQEIIDAINAALHGMFPYVYQPVVDTSLTCATNQYQYVIPNMPGFSSYPIPIITKLEVLQPGDYRFRGSRRYEINRGTVTAGSPSSSGNISSTYPVLVFRSLPPIGATIRIHGYGPFSPLVNLTDPLPALFPPQCEYLLTKLAAHSLLMSGEAGRDRSDSGPVDRREEANRVGASLSTAMSVLTTAEQELLHTAMPPLPRHVKSTI